MKIGFQIGKSPVDVNVDVNVDDIAPFKIFQKYTAQVSLVNDI